MNPRDYRPCLVCAGNGSITHNPDPFGCVVFERDTPCKCCDGAGYVLMRNAVADPLDLMHAARPRRKRFAHDYQIARMRAMRPVSGLALADMLARATMCATESGRAIQAWRAA